MHNRKAKKRATSSFVGSAEKNDYNLEEARNDIIGNNGMEKEKRQVSGSTELRSPRMNSVLINSIVFIVGLSIGIGGMLMLSASYCGMDMQTQKDTMAPAATADDKETVESKWAIVMASSNEPYYHLSLRLTQAYAKRHGM